jgi:hypothetical protein
VYFTLTEGRRHKWTVKVKASRLLGCCDERLSYHAERIEAWDGARKDAEDKLRADGIQLRHYSVTGGERMEAQLDASLAKRVSECEAKLRDHRDAENRFRAYRSFFVLSGDADIELTADDVLYFNLEGADAGTDGE